VLPGSAQLDAPVAYELTKAIYRMRDDFEITGPDGKVAYKVKKHEGQWLDKQIYMDTKGNKLAVLGREIVFPFFHAKFTYYTYKPNFEGQESTGEDFEGAALYPFALLRCCAPRIPPKYEYFLYKTSNLEADLEKVSTINSAFTMFRKNGLMSDQKGQPILKFEEAKDEKGQLNGHIDMEMAAGTDPLQNILIGITIDEETTKSR